MFSSSCGEKIHLRNMVGGSCVPAPCMFKYFSFLLHRHALFLLCIWTLVSILLLKFPRVLPARVSFLSFSGDMFAVKTVIHSRFIPLTLFFPRMGHSNCKQTDVFNRVITDFPQVQFVRTAKMGHASLTSKKRQTVYLSNCQGSQQDEQTMHPPFHEARETGESNISTSTVCKPDGLLSTENTIVEHLPSPAKGMSSGSGTKKTQRDKKKTERDKVSNRLSA